MSRRFLTILFFTLLAASLLFCACTDTPDGGTDVTTDSGETTLSATEAPTEAPTETPTEEPPEAPTEAPTEPETTAPETEPEPYVPILRFVVASDTHITGTNTLEAQRLNKLFASSFRYAEGHADYQGMDAFVFVGDVTNNGVPSDYTALKTLLQQNTEGKDTQVILTMGNHEWFSGTDTRFVEMTGQPLYQDVVIKGFHFIGLAPIPGDAYNGEALSFMSKSLKAANEEDPEKPIFTFQHHHLRDTVYVSHDWYTHTSDSLKGLFRRYPQVINFSGHSHGPINIPTSIWQDKFTALGTGTISYFEMAPGMTDGPFPAGYGEAAQFYIVEVDEKNHVRILPYNILTDSFFKTPSPLDDENATIIYDIVTPSDPDSFTYANREETAEAPYFAEGAEVEVISSDTNTVTVKVPTALDRQCLYGYDFVLESENGSKVEYKAFYQFYIEPLPSEMTYTVKGLKDSTTYTLTVYPVNCFDKRGEGIKTTVTTKMVERHDYVSQHPVNYVGTFTNFDSATSLSASPDTFAYGGTVGGDIFVGDWSSNNGSAAAQYALSPDRGYQGSAALDVWATNNDNRGLYVFATDENGYTTQFNANDYLRVWVDFTDLDFRKMNFGLVSLTGGLYTTDEGDGRSDQAFYYLPEGATEWQTYYHGDDGCIGVAQNTPVKGYKGWMAFPVKDFLYRVGTGSGTVSAGSAFNQYEFVGIYVFWDYADGAPYAGTHFYLDEFQLVADYQVFEDYNPA